MKQQEKTQLTRRELTEAMMALFLDKGYAETTVRDITNAAGFSVGTFYRHWQSKQQAFMELWDGYVSGFIRESVETAAKQETCAGALDYLIARANQFAQNELTVKLYLTSRVQSAMYDYAGVNAWAERYREMLVELLRRFTACREENKLLATASLMHVLLDSHAMKDGHIASGVPVDDATLRACLLAMVDTLG